MGTRAQLHNIFIELLGSAHVYYQPPESVKMEYTAIRYTKKNIESRYANNATYSLMRCYEVIVIAKRPDDPVIDKLLALPYCSYDRNYKSDGLEHDVFTLYY